MHPSDSNHAHPTPDTRRQQVPAGVHTRLPQWLGNASSAKREALKNTPLAFADWQADTSRQQQKAPMQQAMAEQLDHTKPSRQGLGSAASAPSLRGALAATGAQVSALASSRMSPPLTCASTHP